MRKMPRRKIALAVVTAMMVLIIAMMLVPGLAADGNGAMINVDDVECQVFVDPLPGEVGEIGEGFSDFISASRTKHISTNSTNLNQTYQCEVEGYAEVDSAITYNSHDYLKPEDGKPKYNCTVLFDSGTDTTSNWQQTINAAGDLKLTCQFNNNQ